MNCVRVQKLAPLYAGKELSVRGMHSVALHARECDKCSNVLAQYAETSRIVAAYQGPEPDDVVFAQIRTAVHNEIRLSALERASIWQRAFLISWRTALAVACCVLILTAILVALRPHRNSAGRANLAFNGKSEGSILPSPSPQSLPAPTQDSDQGARKPSSAKRAWPGGRSLASDGRRHHRTDEAHGKNYVAARIINDRSPEPQSNIRIEFQTSDPHIRIIWLTPHYGEPSESAKQASDETEDETTDETGEK